MHAFIVTGCGADLWIKTILKERSVSPHDTTTIIEEGTTIGIDAVRPIAPLLSIRPVAGKRRAVIIRRAHTMTVEAQNALLKTLEEPPQEAIIILETDHPETLLPTILSRCHTIRLNQTATRNDPLLPCLETVERLRSSSIGRRLQLVDSVSKTRDDALSFVDCAIAALHPDRENGETARLLRRLLTARARILGNVNPRLSLDAAFLPNGHDGVEAHESNRERTPARNAVAAETRREPEHVLH